MTKEIEELVEAAKSLSSCAPEMPNQMVQDAFDRMVDAIKKFDLSRLAAAVELAEKYCEWRSSTPKSLAEYEANRELIDLGDAYAALRKVGEK